MSLRGLIRWSWLLPVLALVVLGSLLARSKLSAWTHARLRDEQQSALQALPETQAAEAVRRLLESSDDGLEIVALALADKRPEVSAAAQSTLATLLLNWPNLSIADRSLQAECLARALATKAPELSPSALASAQHAAHILLSAPVDGRQIDTAQLIAHCEAILRLQADFIADATEVEPRLGALPAPTATADRVQ